MHRMPFAIESFRPLKIGLVTIMLHFIIEFCNMSEMATIRNIGIDIDTVSC